MKSHNEDQSLKQKFDGMSLSDSKLSNEQLVPMEDVIAEDKTSLFESNYIKIITLNCFENSDFALQIQFWETKIAETMSVTKHWVIAINFIDFPLEIKFKPEDYTELTQFLKQYADRIISFKESPTTFYNDKLSEDNKKVENRHELINTLFSLPELEDLSLGSMVLDKQAADAITNALNNNSKLRDLALTFIGFIFDLEHVYEAMAKNQSLQTLSLSWTDYTKERNPKFPNNVTKQVAFIIHNNKTLQKMKICSYADGGLYSDEAEILMDAISKNKNLLEICLKMPHFHGNYMKAFCSAISSHPTLIAVNVDVRNGNENAYNGKEDAKQVLDNCLSLLTNTRLTSLELKHQNFQKLTSEDVNQLALAISKNTSLTRLGLKGSVCTLSNKSIYSFLQTALQNEQLNELCISHENHYPCVDCHRYRDVDKINEDAFQANTNSLSNSPIPNISLSLTDNSHQNGRSISYMGTILDINTMSSNKNTLFFRALNKSNEPFYDYESKEIEKRTSKNRQTQQLFKIIAVLIAFYRANEDNQLQNSIVTLLKCGIITRFSDENYEQSEEKRCYLRIP